MDSLLDNLALERLLLDLESDRVERTASAKDRDKLRQAICAFANDLPNSGRPGVIFIGANDDGSCANLPITDGLLQSLGHLRDDGQILSVPSLTVEKRLLHGCVMAVVIVQPALAPPVRVQGRTWIRVGPRRALATPEEEKRLAERRRASDLPFELQPIRAADLDDLDLDLFHRVYLPAAVAPEALAGNRRSTEEQLQALRFADGELHPTVLGLLVVGKDPRRFVPGAYVQFLRIDGNDLGDPIRDQKEIGGPLPELLRLLDEVLEVNISTAISITSAPTEIRQPDYPMAALQQLARNAVMHRAYEGTHAQVLIYWFRDRVEIHSPGGPFGGVSRENFGQPGVTDYRNLNLAAAMKALGYVQNFGVGIPTARRALAANGNPPPEFQIQPAHVLAILRRRP